MAFVHLPDFFKELDIISPFSPEAAAVPVELIVATSADDRRGEFVSLCIVVAAVGV